jgi:hypothetical protein
MTPELKKFLIKFVGLLITTPIMGFCLLLNFEYFEKIWKQNNRRKKWLVMCGVFFLLACISGWLRQRLF